MRKLIGLIGIGAALTYFFDPQQGRRRRTMARDKVAAFFRSRAREGERIAGSASAQADALKQKATHMKEEPKPQPDDVTLARKVETEIFRDPEVPKGQINVNAENGKVVLRGEVSQPELIKDLEERARSVQGVQEVENLLHTPG
ncbi:MAG TPA: BON domain-containing protein, partial [Gaiellaceae bacterium]|nr:BON domain-containing protein [Gaiellaceae bacterium]